MVQLKAAIAYRASVEVKEVSIPYGSIKRERRRIHYKDN